MKSKKALALLIGLVLIVSMALPGTLAVSADQATATDTFTAAEETQVPTTEETQAPMTEETQAPTTEETQAPTTAEPTCTCGTETGVHGEDCPLYVPETNQLTLAQAPAAAQAGDYNMACEPGHIRIKINVYRVAADGTEKPWAGVPVDVRRLASEADGWTKEVVLFSETSDKNGVAYFDRTYTKSGSSIYLNNLDGTPNRVKDAIVFASNRGDIRFDVNPTSDSGYRLNWANGKIRNFVTGKNSRNVPLSTAIENYSYDDIAFENGIGDSGASVEFDLYVTGGSVGSSAQGVIHLNSWLWDHDAYNGTYGTGQTDKTVGGLKYDLVYYDYDNPNTTRHVLNVDATVNESGEKTIILSAAQLQAMEDFRKTLDNKDHLTLDIGPSMTPASDGNIYAWDWQTYEENGGSAAVIGVRTMLVKDASGKWTMGKQGGTDTPTVGRYTYSPNQNHTPWLSEDLLAEGFEIEWNCYVTPSKTVTFDSGEGTGSFPLQYFEPVNSLPDDETSYLVKNPGTPTPPTGKTFVGWYMVIDGETLESTPWNFANRIVTKTMTLKAVYADKKYTVKFEVPGGTSQENQYIAGDKPAWNGADPEKTGYAFVGWKETDESGNKSTLYIFRAKYDIDKTSREIYPENSEDPVTVTASFAETTVYTAQFEQLAEIKYQIVGPTDCGTLDRDSETLKAISDTAQGSMPTAASGFKFAGWYTDADCKEPVNGTWVKDNKLTPQKENLGDGVTGYKTATYYVKFEYDVADLTITKTGCKETDKNQSFLFEITGEGYSGKVVINGNGSVTVKGLKIGEYTVKEVTGWSWRYTPEKGIQSVTLQPEKTNNVTFANTCTNDKWLSGDDYSQNKFIN